MSSSIEETIRIIEAEISEKQAALRVLYQMINRPTLVVNGSSNATLQMLEPHSNNWVALDFAFPKNSRTDKQVMFLFDKIFTRAQKYSTIQRKFNELLGAEKNVYNVCRALKKQGHLAAVQYNKQNKLSFWGKTSWVDATDFKDQFKPDPDEMPIEVFDTRMLIDESEIMENTALDFDHPF